ncbi:MAG: hypothetical protein A2Z88_07080 [Omnitrophica WOR_2 bacterium GWA2_47_8]|nr:MAG: hypothetical protein A2Z88_07080 [Omnitrophica WOR_2 bacterium GWA2_47_8]
MKEWLLIFRNCILALIVIAVGSALPPLQSLEDWMTPLRMELIWLTTGMAFFGWALLIGAALYRIATGGGSLKRNEIEATIQSVKDAQSISYSFRASKYWVPKKAWGAGFSDEVSFAQVKAAWRLGLWRQDPRWRGLFIMGLGAVLMAVGGFGIIIVLGAPGLKSLAVGALLYAAVRTTWGFLRA